MRYTIKQVDEVLLKAKNISARTPSFQRPKPIYTVPTKPIKVYAQSVDSNSLEEYELLSTRKANFCNSN